MAGKSAWHRWKGNAFMPEEKRPEIVVFSGPNGSGKSTITATLRPLHLDYINADDIKRILQCTDLEAAQLAERQREEHVRNGTPFCFETVMSTRRNLDLLRRAKPRFFIRVQIVVTVNSSINVARVHGRVLAGGHDVPVDKIRSRYVRSMALVKEVVAVADVCNIFDNSFDQPVRFFNKKKDRLYYETVPLWSLEEIQQLTGQQKNLQTRNLNQQNLFGSC